MSVIPSLTAGMMGNKMARVTVPSTGMSIPTFGNSQPSLGEVKYTKAPPILNSAIDYSTRNGVLPCRGITNHILRSPNPIPASNAYQAPMGIGRGQDKGLAYSSRHPLNLPIMPIASSVFPGQNSTLGGGPP